jgi:hypothetical protein
MAAKYSELPPYYFRIAADVAGVAQAGDRAQGKLLAAAGDHHRRAWLLDRLRFEDRVLGVNAGAATAGDVVIEIALAMSVLDGAIANIAPPTIAAELRAEPLSAREVTHGRSEPRCEGFAAFHRRWRAQKIHTYPQSRNRAMVESRSATPA